MNVCHNKRVEIPFNLLDPQEVNEYFLSTFIPADENIRVVRSTSDFYMGRRYDKSKPRNDEVDVWKEEASEDDTVFNYLTGGSDSNTRYPRVLNFFPVPVEEECSSNDGRRKGLTSYYENEIRNFQTIEQSEIASGIAVLL
nr:unnamed protein product [Callosobruchus chinensis]